MYKLTELDMLETLDVFRPVSEGSGNFDRFSQIALSARTHMSLLPGQYGKPCINLESRSIQTLDISLGALQPCFGIRILSSNFHLLPQHDLGGSLFSLDICSKTSGFAKRL